MKKIIIVCGIIILLCGCRKEYNLRVDAEKINKYFLDNVEDDNLEAFYIDEENNIIVISLLDNSKEKQEDFKKYVKVDSEHIKFISGLNYVYDSSKINYFISKLGTDDLAEIEYINLYKEYYKNEEMVIYLSVKLDEFYVITWEHGVKSLKNYAPKINQSISRTIEQLTDKLNKKYSYDDGGTTIYNSKEKDITMVVCNTLNGNKDVYIGDYSMEYEEYMCK